MSQFNIDILKDPRVFMENRLPAHSDHSYYSYKQTDNLVDSDFHCLLNGQWKFSYAKNTQQAVNNFWSMDFDSRSWDDITVPGHVEMQGYGHPTYVNTQYPWDGTAALEPGQVPEDFNPTSSYVRYFTLDESMKEGPVYISFQGVESAFALWLNGNYVGYSEDSFTPSEFDLTPFIDREGENKLAVRVFRFSSASWCEDQDFFRFSGIFRDVYLYTIPKTHIRDMKVHADFDEKGDGILELWLESTSEGEAEISLRDQDGEKKSSVKAALSSGEISHVSIQVEAAKKWSAEHPYLYDLLIKVNTPEGNTVEYIPEKVGFRRFEIKDSLMLLNGERIVFNGVNRHEFSSISGRCIDDQDIAYDLVTMKQNNINAVRTCHYPNRTLIYRLCDRLGLYMIDETNLETHAVWDAILRGKFGVEYSVPGDRPEFLDMVLDRAKSMYERDKNHPAILMWSCGNEAYGGKDIFEMSEWFRKTDPTRIVHYEGSNWERDPRYPDTSDINTSMYLPADELGNFLKEHREKPYILCEYAHAMGNSCGALYKYIKLSEEEKLYQGGFIWDYIDQCIATKDRFGNIYMGYGGDFDDYPSDGSFSGDGIVYGDNREPSPKMQEVKYCYQSIFVDFEKEGKMSIRNKFLFTSTDEFDCICVLEKEDQIIARENLVLDVAPQSEASFPIPFEIPEEDGEYLFNVSFRLKKSEAWAPAGHEIAWGQKIFGRQKPISHKKRHMKVTQGWLNTGVRGDDFSILFSNLFGGLVSYKYAGREMMKKSPMPNFWRPMTENDIAALLPFKAAPWKTASLYLTHKYEHGRRATDYVVEEMEDSVIVKYTYHLPTNPAKDCELKYTVHSDGVVDTELRMDGSMDVGLLPEFGVLFAMDADFDRVRWYGKGPEETYADKDHARVGVYENFVRENMARYLRPQECGNKTGVRWAEILDRNDHGLRFFGEDLSFSALPWSPHQIDNADHPNELPPVLRTYVRVALAQIGVGGDDTWGAEIHPEYLIDQSGELLFKFSFRGV